MIPAADLLGIHSGLPLWPYLLLAACALPAVVLLLRRGRARWAAAVARAAEMGGRG